MSEVVLAKEGWLMRASLVTACRSTLWIRGNGGGAFPADHDRFAGAGSRSWGPCCGKEACRRAPLDRNRVRWCYRGRRPPVSRHGLCPRWP